MKDKWSKKTSLHGSIYMEKRGLSGDREEQIQRVLEVTEFLVCLRISKEAAMIGERKARGNKREQRERLIREAVRKVNGRRSEEQI